LDPIRPADIPVARSDREIERHVRAEITDEEYRQSVTVAEGGKRMSDHSIAQPQPQQASAPGRPLEGKVSVITGASRGIGAATAIAFADAGAAVAIAARSADRLEELAARIDAYGGSAIAVPTDVGDVDSVRLLVERTVAAFGRLDLAVNNAAGGGAPPTPLADIPVEAYDSAIAITLRSVFLSMKFEIAAMLEHGDGGAIVNMASTAGLEAVGGLAGYVSAKHGVIGLTKTAALDYGDRNIRVNALAPGPILTDNLAHAGDEAQRQAAMALPLRRIGRPEEVARAVVWLCSDAASFISGATLPTDGGKLAGVPPFNVSTNRTLFSSRS
jgi:NAD(P)-dependent dehydrogenase (short-subunit alcohol dehydrogenase family)